MSTPANKPRVIVIAGATGTGKSRLAVALAEKYNGEIINGDALQMYEGLPIATNKLPLPDRKSIPHHLLGFVKWDEEPWTVGKYVAAAIGIIRDIASRGKLPIIVGGTHYYMQSLLFQCSLVDGNAEHQTAQDQERKWPLLAAPTRDMLEKLRAIDPKEAARWHPNDRRKIRHSLEVYFTSGRIPSDIYWEQRAKNAAGSAIRISDHRGRELNEGPFDDDAAASLLRYDPLILWLYADLDKLSTRLNQRVDTMIRAGLIGEVESMQQVLKERESSGIAVNQRSGIWVAIGFKELLASHVLASLDTDLGRGGLEKTQAQGIEQTKAATRQYARQQHRWIRSKLLQALEKHRALERMVLLDGTELSLWHRNVEATASKVVSAFLKGDSIPRGSMMSNVESEILVPRTKPNIKARYCEICDMTLMTQDEWNAHPKSKKHRRSIRTAVDWQAQYPKSLGQETVFHAGSAPDER
ncbi:MAG: hypothetical protein LQ341_000400 [Variospora aurantia]|nr:MAG: hypothetical protein LQ341_000400 [Variospora aurantia]